jgi:hypothetical protein
MSIAFLDRMVALYDRREVDDPPRLSEPGRTPTG